MHYQLIAFDLDGTLLDGQKRIPARHLDALRRAKERGVTPVPATGRLPKGLPRELLEEDLVRYCISVNGAYVCDLKTGAVIYRAEIPLDTTLEIYGRLAGLEASPDVYQNNEGWLSREYYDRMGEFVTDPALQKVYLSQRNIVPELRAVLRERGLPVQKISAYFKDLELRRRTQDTLAADYPGLQVTTSIINNIEITAGAADKGRALTALCAYLGIPQEATVAFGDNGNDTAMLKAAGLGVAMGNATPELKRVAGLVTLTNEEGGIAAALEQLGVI